MAKNRFTYRVSGSTSVSWQGAASDGAVIAETAEIAAHLEPLNATPFVVLMPATVLPGSLVALQQQVFAAAFELARATLAPPRHERLVEAGWN